MTYDESLFAGTAPYYAQFRPPYPAQLIGDIVAHYALNGKGRLLDLGCGPGTLTLPLSRHFASVLATDMNASMIEEGRRVQQYINEFRKRDIEWRVMRGEEITKELGTFRLVTCGSSFHWMDRDLVLQRVQDVLEPGCGIALAGGGGGWLDGPEDWHQALTAVVTRYLGERRRAGGTEFKKIEERFEGALERNGWLVELNRDYPTVLEWDLDSVIGFLWSTSFANRTLLGDKVGQFESDLRADLLRVRPDGVFREISVFGLVCGRPR